MYNDRDQCVVEIARENTQAPLKVIIDECYKKSGEMIEECLVVASHMFGDDFPKLPNKEQEPQTLLQTVMLTANRMADLQNMLNALYLRTLG